MVHTLSEEAIDGLLLNLPALEAKEDLRQTMGIGALLGGEKGQEYLRSLYDKAWMEIPERVAKANKMTDIANSKRKKDG